MMRRICIVLIGSIGLLIGCVSETDQCDPAINNTSFISKFNCQFSGEYERRIATKQLELENEKALNEDLKQLYNTINIEKDNINQQIKFSKAELIKLRATLTNLSMQLKKSNQTLYNAHEAQLVTDIQNQLNSLDTKPDDVIMLKEKDLEKLRKRVSALQQALGLE